MKVYIDVYVEFRPEGLMLPRVIIWEDGLRYKIDRVKAIKTGETFKGNREGDRYTVIVRGQERYLFYEHIDDGFGTGRWYIEREAS